MGMGKTGMGMGEWDRRGQADRVQRVKNSTEHGPAKSASPASQPVSQCPGSVVGPYRKTHAMRLAGAAAEAGEDRQLKAGKVLTGKCGQVSNRQERSGTCWAVGDHTWGSQPAAQFHRLPFPSGGHSGVVCSTPSLNRA